MCIKTKANDGGLHKVLQTSERVSNGLLALSHPGVDQSSAAASVGTKRKKPFHTLSEIAGNADRSVRMDLARHTSAELKQIVAPLIGDLKKIDAATLLSLNPSKDGGGAILDPRTGLTAMPIHGRITPQYEDEGHNIVRYLHVKEVQHKYSVGIFIFPPLAEMPLHDHPDMVVLSRVLYGELQVQSYDVMPENSNKNVDHNGSPNFNSSCNEKAIATSSSRLSAIRESLHKVRRFASRALSYQDNQANSVLHVKPNLKPMGVQMQDDDGPPIISAPNVTCLYPHEGNCHSFMAGPHGAAVLDVLMPPYDSDDERDCTFYEMNDDSIPPEQPQIDNVAKSWMLSPIDQPEDFHCLSGEYGRFGSDEDIGDDGMEDPK